MLIRFEHGSFDDPKAVVDIAHSWVRRLLVVFDQPASLEPNIALVPTVPVIEHCHQRRLAGSAKRFLHFAEVYRKKRVSIEDKKCFPEQRQSLGQGPAGTKQRGIVL